MKALLLFIMVVPTLVSAQLAQSFEGNNPGIYRNIGELISKGSKTLYTYKQTDSTAKGYYTSTYTSAANDTLTIVVHDSLVGKTATHHFHITSITGPFELLFPFWKFHFEAEASEKALLVHEHGNAWTYKRPNGREKIFSFGKVENGNYWRIRAKDW